MPLAHTTVVQGLSIGWEIIDVDDGGEADEGGRHIVVTCAVMRRAGDLEMTRIPLTLTPEQLALMAARYSPPFCETCGKPALACTCPMGRP